MEEEQDDDNCGNDSALLFVFDSLVVVNSSFLLYSEGMCDVRHYCGMKSAILSVMLLSVSGCRPWCVECNLSDFLSDISGVFFLLFLIFKDASPNCEGKKDDH